MRIAFVSDMHGNLPAFDAVIERLRELGGFDEIVAGGDYAFNGAYPAECVSRLRKLGWPAVRGNTDEWIVQMATDGRVPVQDCPNEAAHDEAMQARDRWAVERLSQEDVDFLTDGLVFDWSATGPSGQTITFVHATPWSTHVSIGPDADDETAQELLDRGATDVLLYGHIHYAYLRQMGDRQLGCIGAVGVPFDNDPRPCFAVAEDTGGGWTVTHERVEYDQERYAQDLQASGMPGAEGVAGIVRTGIRP